MVNAVALAMPVSLHDVGVVQDTVRQAVAGPARGQKVMSYRAQPVPGGGGFTVTVAVVSPVAWAVHTGASGGGIVNRAALEKTPTAPVRTHATCAS